MNSVVLLLRVALSAVFTVAGATKLFDLELSQETLAAFGLPRRAARYGGAALPFAELATALALLIEQASRWGAAAAVILLVTFIAGVSYALSQGRRPECNCFGQVAPAQISWRTLARNALLLVLAAFTVWKSPGSSLGGWTSALAAANLVAGVAVLACLLLGVATLHFYVVASRDSADAPGTPAAALATGSPAPAFELPDLSGSPVSLDALLSRGLPVILVFASPTCGPCAALMPELLRWSVSLSQSITLALIESGVADVSELPEPVRAADSLPVLWEQDRAVAAAYHSPGTPSAVSIGADGTIVDGPIPGGGSIEALIRATLRAASQAGPTARTLETSNSA